MRAKTTMELEYQRSVSHPGFFLFPLPVAGRAGEPEDLPDIKTHWQQYIHINSTRGVDISIVNGVLPHIDLEHRKDVKT